ncbi:hypothetical protein BG261_05250 [Floricoccus tropicus]|uniref:Lipoprotein n=1 Tax=Floricoccus tropicus TaxID=1859473 RepID=A0A1E8GLE1_9LACT|nr:hypothetical protein [Floricoccus tropicus]OFI48796.1 hypothetical protein BG261_05250 [Floricoccus tropicus]
MRRNRKTFLYFLLLCLVSVNLSACKKNNKEESVNNSMEITDSSSKNKDFKVNNDEEKNISSSVKAILDCIYGGNENDVNRYFTQSYLKMKNDFLSSIVNKEKRMISMQGDFQTLKLVSGRDTYSAEDIVNEYAKTYLENVSKIHDYSIDNLDQDGEYALVSIKMRPIAGASEIKDSQGARIQVFGDEGDYTIIRESDNTSPQETKSLIELKLFSTYYGQMNQVPPFSDQEKTINFKLKKNNDNYQLDPSEYQKLIKQARDETYSKDKKESRNSNPESKDYEIASKEPDDKSEK